MNVKELMTESHRIAVFKGWWQDKRSEGELVALMHSELSEALEIARDPGKELGDLWIGEGCKPEGFMVEIADLLIRMADACEGLAIPLDMEMPEMDLVWLEQAEPRFEEMSLPGEWLAEMHAQLSKAHDGLKCDHDKALAAAGFASLFDMAVAIFGKVKDLPMPASVSTLLLCGKLGAWTLESIVIWKLRYNETRKHRHGGKRC
jgi:hypothetical protein